MTKTGTKVLQVELKDWNDKIGLAEYDHFSIGDETALYKLKLGKYTGGIGKLKRLFKKKNSGPQDYVNYGV